MSTAKAVANKHATDTAPASSWFTTASPWLSLVARLGLAAMWLYYSVPKLTTPVDALQLSVHQYRILPTGLANLFADVQPYLEMCLGLLVLLGLGTRIVAILSGLLLLVYIGGIISLGARGIAINCGCGGVASQATAGHTRYTLDVLRDIGYMVPAAWLVWRPRSKASLDELLLPPAPPPVQNNRVTSNKSASGRGSRR